MGWAEREPFVAFSGGMRHGLDKSKAAGSAPDLSLPPIGLAVGLDPEGYGNPDFCWISIHDKLVWSFAGPITVVIVVKPCPVSPTALSCLPSAHHGHSPLPWLPTACPVLCTTLPQAEPSLYPFSLQSNQGRPWLRREGERRGHSHGPGRAGVCPCSVLGMSGQSQPLAPLLISANTFR